MSGSSARPHPPTAHPWWSVRPVQATNSRAISPKRRRRGLGRRCRSLPARLRGRPQGWLGTL